MEHIGEILKRAGPYPNEVPTKPPRSTERLGEIRYCFGVVDKAHTFGSLKEWPGTGDALEAFRGLAEGKADYYFLLVYGGVGNGKTHLVDATALRLAERQIQAQVWVVPDFLAYLKRLMKSEYPWRLDDMIQNYQNGKGAVLFDDFALEYGTAWEESVMERVIAGRYRNKGITVLTTNKDLDSIPERIVSRFYEPGVGKVVLNQGKDYRRRRAK